MDNLGDTSKLDFLKDLPVNEGQEVTGEEQTPGDQEPESSGPAPTEEAQPEPGAESAAEEPPPAPEAPAPKSKRTSRPDQRDYSDIEPAHVPAFKQMSDAAFQLAKEHYLRAREIQGHYDKIKDQQYWQHEDAYRLSPDYHVALKEFSSWNNILKYWQSAKLAAARGQTIRDITINKDGTFTPVGDPLESSPELIAQIDNTLMEVNTAAHESRQKLNGFQGQYKQRFTEFERQMTEVENGAFGKLREHKEFQEMEAQELKRFPPELRGSRVFKLLASALALNAALRYQLTDLNKKVGAATSVRNAMKTQGPGDGAPGNGSSAGADDPEKFMSSLTARLGR